MKGCLWKGVWEYNLLESKIYFPATLKFEKGSAPTADFYWSCWDQTRNPL